MSFILYTPGNLRCPLPRESKLLLFLYDHERGISCFRRYNFTFHTIILYVYLELSSRRVRCKHKGVFIKLTEIHYITHVDHCRGIQWQGYSTKWSLSLWSRIMAIPQENPGGWMRINLNFLGAFWLGCHPENVATSPAGIAVREGGNHSV